GDLYERVDGLNTYEIQIRLALGEQVRWTQGQGKFRVGHPVLRQPLGSSASGRDGAAASFVMRRFEDGRCVRVPTTDELDAVRRLFPGTTIKVMAHVGERLSAQDQDVGSFRYAIINMGAKNAETLHANYREVEGMLRFEFR